MGITCPACKKAGQTNAACARCGCDLGRLQTVVRTSARELLEGCNALRLGDWDSALRFANRSWGLCHSVEAARLAFIAAGALGDTAAALVWHRRAG